MAPEIRKKKAERMRSVADLREALAWESRQRTPGTLARCAELYRQINALRAGLRIVTHKRNGWTSQRRDF
jgi:hypothetical protein